MCATFNGSERKRCRMSTSIFVFLLVTLSQVHPAHDPAFPAAPSNRAPCLFGFSAVLFRQPQPAPTTSATLACGYFSER